jgi:glycerophosphoryl diester phosphodiesterase
MRELISVGVDGIITNYPDRLVELLRETQKAKP